MKFLIASDIHGSAYYAKKVAQCFEKEKCDKLILLGDILYHGPRNDLPREYAPKVVGEVLNALKDKILCVRGNCDAEVDQMVLKFPVLVECAYLVINEKIVLLAHGHKLDNEQKEIVSAVDVVISGHTHVPVCNKVGDKLFLNPGSTSIPKENSVNQFMIIDGNKLLWKDFDGNILRESQI